MPAPKTYRCLSYPSLQLGELKFENGTFTTAEPRQQRFVERHPEFIRGAIVRVADGFQVAGAFLSTEIRPDPGLRQSPNPVFVPEPIPPPDPRLLRALGLPLPGSTPEPAPEPIPDLFPELTLTPEERVALNKITSGEPALTIQPVDIPPGVEPDKSDATPVVAVVEVGTPPDTTPLEKLPYPSIARRWSRLRLVKLAVDRGIVGAEGATKDALIDLLYPDAE